MIATNCMMGTCEASSRLLPVLIVHEMGVKPTLEARLVLSFPVCVACSVRVTVCRLISEPTWMMLDGALAAKRNNDPAIKADRGNARLEFIPLDHPEAKQVALARDVRLKRLH